jgi:CelD/BcsL family acetyltransferase involved in cellulose biosynthesis
LLIEDHGGQTVGLLPTCIQRCGPARWLRFLGRDRVSGDHLDLLCAADDHHACLNALLQRWQTDRTFDGILLGELHRDSPTLTRIRFWARQRGLPVQEREPQVVPYLDLPASFDDFLTTLSANMRYHVRRRRRGVVKTRGAAVRVLRAADEVDGALTDLFQLHQRRWERDRQRGNFHDPRKRDFLRRFCRLAAKLDRVRAVVLEVDGVRQGVLLAFHWRGTASFYQMGWDPDTRIDSPGVVLLAESIAQAIREGLTHYDFLRGDEEYKRRWTSQAVEQITLVVGCRAPARAAIAAAELKDGFKRAVQWTLGSRNWERMRGLARTWEPRP